MGKAEGDGKLLHGHITAVTIGQDFRRLGLAKQLVEALEEVSDKVYHGYFVDLFVRVSNSVAISMYRNLGYSVFRTVLSYYGGGGHEEDAYDMRKCLSKDTKRASIRENGEKVLVHPEELEWA